MHMYTKAVFFQSHSKKCINTLAKPFILPARSSTVPIPSPVKGKVSVTAPSYASRLIIRNIPFNATEQDLRAIFLPYGPIHSIQIPIHDKTTKKDDDDDVAATPTANKRVRTKGFAFVWMLSKKELSRDAME